MIPPVCIALAVTLTLVMCVSDVFESTPTIAPTKRPSYPVPYAVKAIKATNCSQRTHYPCDKGRNTTLLGPFRIKMYVFCHNDASCSSAANTTASITDWTIEILRVRKTFYFESIVYSDIFVHITNEWDDYDYIITSTYKTLTNPRFTKISSLQKIRNEVELLRRYDVDVVPFHRSSTGYLHNLLRAHSGYSVNAFFTVLNHLGYTDDTILEFACKRGFFRNVYIIKPKILIELAGLMKQVINIMETKSEVQPLMRRNAGYNTLPSEIALKVFGSPHYFLHPFLSERFPVFFLHTMGAKVCDASDGTYDCACPTTFME